MPDNSINPPQQDASESIVDKEPQQGSSSGKDQTPNDNSQEQKNASRNDPIPVDTINGSEGQVVVMK
ncbi:hypothetical protein CEP51_014802 [Fusarium floridanum]|uniref:Uncharacterized protein n=1 Tax=Fusarium floridanum TaxID=1325733 RepID=A0A428PLL9_9HYPO|nr:hypothetical protein CEP51_014802 [Fusarium floridanum]